MSMDGEILQRLRNHEERLKRLEVRAGLLPEGSTAASTLRVEMLGDDVKPTWKYAVVCDPNGWYDFEIVKDSGA